MWVVLFQLLNCPSYAMDYLKDGKLSWLTYLIVNLLHVQLTEGAVNESAQELRTAVIVSTHELYLFFRLHFAILLCAINWLYIDWTQSTVVTWIVFEMFIHKYRFSDMGIARRFTHTQPIRTERLLGQMGSVSWRGKAYGKNTVLDSSFGVDTKLSLVHTRLYMKQVYWECILNMFGKYK